MQRDSSTSSPPGKRDSYTCVWLERRVTWYFTENIRTQENWQLPVSLYQKSTVASTSLLSSRSKSTVACMCLSKIDSCLSIRCLRTRDRQAGKIKNGRMKERKHEHTTGRKIDSRLFVVCFLSSQFLARCHTHSTRIDARFGGQHDSVNTLLYTYYDIHCVMFLYSLDLFDIRGRGKRQKSCIRKVACEIDLCILYLTWCR